jgi:long-subunit acyl-CoA synthetase (AMP-forming)
VPGIHELFLQALERGPDQIFLRHVTRHGERRRSFREAAAAIARIVDRLQAMAIGRAARAVVYADAVSPSIHFMLACAFAGLPFAPLAPTCSVEVARKLQQRLAARIVFTTHDHAARLRAAGIRALCDGGAAGDDDALDLWCTPRDGDLEILRACCRGRSSDEPYVILFTSGTTGEPKLPVRSHLAASLAAQRYREALGPAAEPRDRLLLCSTLTHGLGQLVLAFGLHLGAELCIPEVLEGHVSLDQVQQLDVNIACVHPRVIQSLYRQHLARGGAPRSRFFGPSLRLLRTAGWSIDPELLHMLAAQGIDVGEWYGSSETSLVAMTPHRGWRPGAIGPVCPGVEVHLAPDGEILVRSPVQMAGYDGDAALTRATLTADGFIQTGDLGELGGDGVLRLVGRKTEILNMLDGTNIAAAPIEDLLISLPWVELAVLVGAARPFLVALVTVRDAPPSSEPDGFLGEWTWPDLYDRARRDLAAINARLDPSAQIRTFALFGKRFAAQLYAEVKLGKIRRDRSGIDTAYRARIEALYARG